jgi:glycosyltransferase involved in cell wall biosynthesis
MKSYIRRAQRRVSAASIDAELERVREWLELREERRLLNQVRAGHDVCWWETPEVEPLVTVRIATFRRRDLLLERALPSVLGQTYERLEVLVIGDATDDGTQDAVRGLRDGRVRFINLPRRGLYPTSQAARWFVSGSHPMNVGNALARGAWIAPLDDDDAFTSDHVAALLAHAQSKRAEFVYSKAIRELGGEWAEVGSEPLQAGEITNGSVLHASVLEFFRYSSTCWRMNEPHDWNLWRRMSEAGVRISFLDEVTLRYFDPADKSDET